MVFETKEQIIKRKKILKYKFKTIVRKVGLNSYWLDELEGLGENVTKNVAVLLKRTKDKQGLLTLQDKMSLRKPPHDRTKEEIHHLEILFDCLPCFKDLSPFTRRELVSAVEFQYFAKDKLILKEGHKPYSMYFIITGEVLIAQSQLVQDASSVVSKHVNILSSGSRFGHLGLIYNMNRNASASTQTNCEMLCVYKEDFDNILKDVLKEKHENVRTAIQRFNYFDNFNEEKISEAAVISKIEQFNPQDIIFSPTEITNFSYFVLSGQCMILQSLKVQQNAKGKLELFKEKETEQETPGLKFKTRELALASFLETTVETKQQLIDVGSLTAGGVFGVGEEMVNRLIIARNLVQCLLIPRHWLFQKAQGLGNSFERINLFLNSSLPSQQTLFKNYLANEKYKRYKKKTIDAVKKQHGVTSAATQYYNIPVICRIEEMNSSMK